MKQPLRRSPLGLALLGCLITATAAHAQTQTGHAIATPTEQFLAEYFHGAAPANAQDMLLRVPGFSIVEADEDVRGYAGALGNVLIDGARPASKREDISSLLKRIPAGSVERIELIRSGTPGIDMGGYALLANVVRRREARVESAMEAGLVASTDGWIAPAAQWEYGRRSDETALDLSVELDPELDDDSGLGRIRISDADGQLQDEQPWETRTISHQGEASASWRQPLALGRLTVSAGLRGEQLRVDSRSGSTPASDDDERVHEEEDSHEVELAARFLRQFENQTTLELVVQQQLGWLQGSEHSVEGGDDELFRKDNDRGESIARVELTHARTATLSFNASLEGAYNFLQSNSRLTENGEDSYLPGSDVRVEEQRMEATLGATWSPRVDWTLDAGMRLERSHLSQTGDTPLERRFSYPKPRLAARWDINPANQLRVSLSREVGQLDFEDFAASASLDSNSVSAGNAELQPDQTWKLTTSWEHGFNNEAALILGWTHDQISDVVDRVLIVSEDDVFDAPGNIGDGRRDTVNLDLSAPLDGLGLRGGRIRSTLLWRQSRVTDPVTGERRGISEEKPFEGEIEISQDLPQSRFNWGLLIEHIAERETQYRHDEIKHESEDASWTLYAERRLGEHWRMRAEATDLFGRQISESREKYDGPRNHSPVEEFERRRRESPGYFSLSFRRSMGG